VAPGKYFDRYKTADVRLARNPANDLDDIPPIVARTLGDTTGNMRMNEDQQREALRAYYASISFMDDQLGRVLETLERLRLREHTVIVFQSDHGWHLGEHGFWQKRSLMEESARVPLIVSAPGRRGRGRATRALTELVDVYPTVAGLCGLTPPAYVQGKSFAHLLDNPSAGHRAAAHTQLDAGGTHGRAVRTEHFRYIRWQSGEGVAEELYDHRSDPGEFTNVSGRPGFGKELARHRALVG
jgi:uncharacterized sulfatase